MDPFTRESFAVTLSPSSRIDRAKGVVYGVRAVNTESANGHYYPPAVLARDSKVYEGAASFWGHRKSPTDNDDPAPKFGRLRNVRAVPGAGLEADLHFNPHHPQAEAFLWACEHDPGFYALSHHARVRWAKQRDAKGRKVAEAILEVASVDVVSSGGTTTSVFESKGTPMTPAEVAATLTDPAAAATWAAEFLAALSPEMQTAVMDAMSGAAMPVDPAADPEAAMEALRRRGGKVGQWAAEALGGYRQADAKAKATAKARTLILAAGLPAAAVTDVFVETVTESLGRGEDAAKALIADRKAVAGTGTPPRTSTPGNGGGKTPKQLAAEFTFD
jgi:hypothetical protein